MIALRADWAQLVDKSKSGYVCPGAGLSTYGVFFWYSSEWEYTESEGNCAFRVLFCFRSKGIFTLFILLLSDRLGSFLA